MASFLFFLFAQVVVAQGDSGLTKASLPPAEMSKAVGGPVSLLGMFDQRSEEYRDAVTDFGVFLASREQMVLTRLTPISAYLYTTVYSQVQEGSDRPEIWAGGYLGEPVTVSQGGRLLSYVLCTTPGDWGKYRM